MFNPQFLISFVYEISSAYANESEYISEVEDRTQWDPFRLTGKEKRAGAVVGFSARPPSTTRSIIDRLSD